VVVASEDSLQSVTKAFTMFLLLLVCVVGVVLGLKTLCCNSGFCNNDNKATMMGRAVEVCDEGSCLVCEEENEVSFYHRENGAT
jgi:hypothetical protein